MKDIRFILERYRAGGSNRYTCPQCGRKKCFTRYVDVDSGEYRRWEERMKESGHGHYHVVDFLEQYEPNTDIADILLGVARKKDLCPF